MKHFADSCVQLLSMGPSDHVIELRLVFNNVSESSVLPVL